jgi:hypothetical protein
MGVKELEAVHLVDSAPAGANVFLTLDKADLLNTTAGVSSSRVKGGGHDGSVDIEVASAREHARRRGEL